mgnify:CR=1 FL=1
MNDNKIINNSKSDNKILIKKPRGRAKKYTEEEIKERRKAQGRAYRARNLEARREACKKCNSKKVSCPGCGAIFNINNMKKHLETKKHKQAMEHIQNMKRNEE